MQSRVLPFEAHPVGQLSRESDARQRLSQVSRDCPGHRRGHPVSVDYGAPRHVIDECPVSADDRSVTANNAGKMINPAWRPGSDEDQFYANVS
jgi:hypothetical protein